MSEITVVDGVPKAVLGEALKQSASTVITIAKQQLRKAIASLNSYSENPDNKCGAFPEPDRLDVEIMAVSTAIAMYREQYDLGQRVWAQGSEMVADAREEETQA